MEVEGMTKEYSHQTRGSGRGLDSKDEAAIDFRERASLPRILVSKVGGERNIRSRSVLVLILVLLLLLLLRYYGTPVLRYYDHRPMVVPNWTWWGANQKSEETVPCCFRRR